jgi:hypothetical protein
MHQVQSALSIQHRDLYATKNKIIVITNQNIQYSLLVKISKILEKQKNKL